MLKQRACTDALSMSPDVSPHLLTLHQQDKTRWFCIFYANRMSVRQERCVCTHTCVHVCTFVNPYLCVHKHVCVRVIECVSGRVTKGGLPSGCCSRARSLTQHWQTMSAHTTPSLLSAQHLLNTHFNKPLAPHCILTSGSKCITMHNTLHKLSVAQY